jgi:crossover junction endodeoxyribonuclease RusA
VSGLTFEVRGIPGPQGSKNQWGQESSAKVKPWREAVRWSCVEAMTEEWGPLKYPAANTVAVEVAITFLLPRPKSHYFTGKRAGELRPDAPGYCAKRPDIDKLTRSTLDALTSAGAYDDDSRVVELHVSKMYADPAPAGAVITVRPL